VFPVGVVESCQVPPVPADSAVNLALDVEYAAPGGESQRLDVAWPKTAGPHPLVVFIHGGGWSAGDKKTFAQDIRRLAGIGYTSATLDYRLAEAGGKNIFPAQVQDVRCAVRWLRAHAAAYDLDPQRVAVIGGSAGGHLTEMLATASDVAGLDDGGCSAAAQPVQISAAVPLYGPSDLRAGAATWSAWAEGKLEQLLGKPPAEVPALAALASPIVHVNAGDPPMLLIHGVIDQVVPISQSRDMKKALDKAGVPAMLVELPLAGHAFPVFGVLPAYQRHACTTLAFLQAVLKP
jgi:acetyl esterase/lipase